MKQKTDPMLGRVLDGRYKITERIAVGGMAVVYQATDLRLDRFVAVKVMHETLATDATFVTRFEREARSAAKLAHPNAVSVFDQGDDDGQLFLVMENVPGITLRDLIRREAPLPSALALRIVEPVLSALSAAHGIGIIHRDIKPENVLLATSDIETIDPSRTKVADFGLARAINTDTQHTTTGGVIIGSVSYLAPEMLVNGVPDARVDVYAVGVMLYELLTGQKPHQAENPIQVAYKHVHEDVGMPSDAVAGIPPYLNALVSLATARNADQRPADAHILLRHVQRVRQAIESGVLDDPDLTAELMPKPTPPGPPTSTGPVAPQVSDPNQELTAPVRTQPFHTPELAVAAGPSRQRFRARRVIAALIALLTLGVLGGGGWYYFIGRYTSTPAVLNLTEKAALQRIQGAGLRGQVTDRAYSAVVAKGLVISSSPKPGSQILNDGDVELVVSLGKPIVPKLVGLTEDTAKARITNTHLTLGVVNREYSDTVDEGVVISSNPAVGTPLAPNGPVTLAVSKGPAPITIPDYTGKPSESALSALKRLGLKVTLGTPQFSREVAKDSIISQTPANTQGHRGDTVTLVVSKGPQTVAVPEIKGLSWKAAVAKLGAAGLQSAPGNAKALAAATFFQDTLGAKSTSPKTGSQIPIGSTVKINF